MVIPSVKNANNEPKGKISKDVKSYGNDPYFQKKAKESKAFLEKHGFPKELLAKK